MFVGVGLSLAATAESVSIPFTPLSLNPALWLDASDLTTITATDGQVSQLQDKSGNGNHASQATGSRQPLSGTQSQNGLNVLDFSSDRLEIPNLGIGDPAQPGNTAVMVFRPQNFRAGANFPVYVAIDGADFNTNSRKPLFHGIRVEPDRLGTAYGTNGIASTITDDQYLLAIKATDNSSTVITSLNGLEVSEPAGVLYSQSSQASLLGRSGGEYFQFAELLVFRRLLDPSERQQLLIALSNKWGLNLT